MVKSEFVELIDKRDNLIKEHFGDDMLEMLNKPWERDWYIKHISPIDYKIVTLSKNILRNKLGLNEKVEDVRDVYQNQSLINYYNSKKEKNNDLEK